MYRQEFEMCLSPRFFCFQIKTNIISWQYSSCLTQSLLFLFWSNNDWVTFQIIGVTFNCSYYLCYKNTFKSISDPDLNNAMITWVSLLLKTMVLKVVVSDFWVTPDSGAILTSRIGFSKVTDESRRSKQYSSKF